MASPDSLDQRGLAVCAAVVGFADLDELAQHVSARYSLQRLQRRAWLQQVRRHWRGRRVLR